MILSLPTAQLHPSRFLATSWKITLGSGQLQGLRFCGRCIATCSWGSIWESRTNVRLNVLGLQELSTVQVESNTCPGRSLGFTPKWNQQHTGGHESAAHSFSSSQQEILHLIIFQILILILLFIEKPHNHLRGRYYSLHLTHTVQGDPGSSQEGFSAWPRFWHPLEPSWTFPACKSLMTASLNLTN